MRKILFLLPMLAVLVAAISANPAWAQSEPGYYSVSDLPPDNLLSPEELDDLLAPIALYPDPLLAQILPAATFVDQIDEAARYVRQFGQYARVDDQPWDISVRAVAHYPDVLYMMDRKYDWTVALGQAYIDQPQDVMESIQVLRAEARDRGNLYSTAQQQVVVEADGDIRIVPAAPQYIYVPVYDPQVIYVEQRPSYGFITFGTGFVIGAWLSRDVDWREHRVYYHGWKGRGWVERSRPHIQDRRGVYINRNASNIVINRRVLQRDSGRFRQELRHDVEQRKTLPGRPIVRPGREQHPRTDQQRPRTDQQRPTDQGRPSGADRGRHPGQEQRSPATAPAPRPAPGQPPAAAAPRPQAAPQQRPGPAATAPASQPAAGRPAATDVFRGRDVQRNQPASRSGYGGYGTSKDATIYRERGQSSRERIRSGGAPGAPQPTSPAAVKPAPAPAARQPAAPAPRATAPQAAPAAPAARPAPRPHVPRPVAPSAAPAAPAAEGGRERR